MQQKKQIQQTPYINISFKLFTQIKYIVYYNNKYQLIKIVYNFQKPQFKKDQISI